MQLDDRLKDAIEEGLGITVSGAEAIDGGRNSRVFRVESDQGPFILKHYPDARRLQAEMSAFQFLTAQNISQVPETLLVDEDNRMAAYALIDGVEVTAANQTDVDIDDCVRFIKSLRRAGEDEAARRFGPAAEAFFRLTDIEANIMLRLERLEDRDRDSRLEAELDAFLSEEFRPALARLTKRARTIYDSLGIAADQPLPDDARLLSPSDFGFHNGLRTAAGMVFCDFEYFGWDDPAKLASDFLLHPGMDIPMESRLRFVRGVVSVMDEPTLIRRIGALLPLFGLKWCVILLNEFLRPDMERREFAGVATSRREVLQAQLDKARAMLETTRNHADDGIDLS